jgi:hypothetical protein
MGIIGVLLVGIGVCTMLVLLSLWAEKTRFGNQVMNWFGKRFLNVCPYPESDKDDEESLFDYEVTGYRLYCKLNGETTVHGFNNEKEVARFINMYKRMYRGKITRLEKIMRAK